MEKDLARHVIRTAFRAGRELEEALHLLKQHTSGEDYGAYARKIAAAIDAINVALINPTLALYPEMKDEIEESIAKYDRFL